MGIRVFRKDIECVTRQIGDETIIVPIRANAADLTAVYTLNESASMVWRHIDGSRSGRSVNKRHARRQMKEEISEDEVEDTIHHPER
jgi:hypothetical protein